MDESHRRYVETKKPEIRVHTDDSIYMKLKNRQKYSLVMVIAAIAGDWVSIDWEGA